MDWNDAIVPSFLIWGFVLVTSPLLRGFFAALSGWTKFASCGSVTATPASASSMAAMTSVVSSMPEAAAVA